MQIQEHKQRYSQIFSTEVIEQMGILKEYDQIHCMRKCSNYFLTSINS